MSLFDDLNAKIDAAQQQSADEHTQVLAAIQALKDNIATDPNLNLTDAQKTQVLAKLDDLTGSIGHVYDPDAPPVAGGAPRQPRK